MSVPVAENHPEAVSNDLHLDIKDNYSNQLYQVYCGLGGSRFMTVGSGCYLMHHLAAFIFMQSIFDTTVICVA